MSPPSSGYKIKPSKKQAWKPVASRDASVDFQRTTWRNIPEDSTLRRYIRSRCPHIGLDCEITKREPAPFPQSPWWCMMPAREPREIAQQPPLDQSERSVCIDHSAALIQSYISLRTTLYITGAQSYLTRSKETRSTTSTFYPTLLINDFIILAYLYVFCLLPSRLLSNRYASWYQ
jgi:hypothetical protein